MKRYLLFLLFVMMGLTLWAQTITVSAPAQVAVGENFRVSYTINTNDIDEFRASVHNNEFVEVIAGPYTSEQSSYQMINGHTSAYSSITYTYTLYAAKNGSFTFSPAHAKVGGKTIASRAIKITVAGTARPGNGAPQMHDEADGQQMQAAGSRISGSDLFVKVSASKRRLHEQEPVLLTYKVYTTVDLTELEGKMPDLTGFHTQEIPLPSQKNFHIEQLNGRTYKAVVWRQYVMYPQMTGKLEIPTITFKGTVVQQNRSVDPFEAFFNGGSGYIEVKRNIVAPGLSIEVVPLPKRPAAFSGGVGKFNICAQLDQSEVKAGTPISLRVVIGGTGNLKLIKQPVVDFPKDFDQYDAKVTDKTKLTVNGLEGNMVYDILAVPRNAGQYTIPPVAFTYYDTGVNAYRTIKTKSLTLNVTPGDGKTSVADFKDEKNMDIRGLKTGSTTLSKVHEFYFGSTGYLVSIILLLVAFVALLIIFRQRALEHADLVKMRGKKANKVASKRLRQANKLQMQGRQQEFYDEVLHALWGYVSDKLNMPVEQLSRENIAGKLQDNGVDASTIDQFISALDECEFERYAPGDPSGNMSKTFESAMKAIMEIENVLKKGRKASAKPSAGAALFLLLLFLPLSGHAITKQNADNEYQKGNYQQAILDYQALLKQGVSADLYYNLGNAYYRSNNMTQAVLAYERAHLLSPGDKDINFNLEFARSKTIDKITPKSEMFFVVWYRSLVNFVSADTWAAVALIALVLALVLLLLYLFSDRLLLRQVGFVGALALLVLFGLANIFAAQQKRAFVHRSGAIVIAPSVDLKAQPTSRGTQNAVIHEGTRVEIVDKSMKGWRQVQLADGREGWLQTQAIEEI